MDLADLIDPCFSNGDVSINGIVDALEREGLVERAATLGRRLLDGLHTLAALPGVGDLRGLGMMAAIELVGDKATKQTCAPAANVGPRVAAEMLKRGLCTRVVGDTICLAPPLVTSEDEVDRIIEIVGAAIWALELA